MSPSSGLDLIGDEIPTLQRVRHSKGPHRDPIRHTDGPKLVPSQIRRLERSLDSTTKNENMLITAVREIVSLPEDAGVRGRTDGFPSYLKLAASVLPRTR